jgi:hypothetical protein
MSASVEVVSPRECVSPPGSAVEFLRVVAQVVGVVGVPLDFIHVRIMSGDSWHVMLHQSAVSLAPLFVAALGASPVVSDVSCLPPVAGSFDGAVMTAYGDMFSGVHVIRVDDLDSYADDLFLAGVGSGGAAGL